MYQRLFVAPCTFFGRGPLLFAACLAVLLGGCGWQTYESRLKDTVAYFEYIEKLDVNLQPTWSRMGVDYRVPQPFREIPAPAVQEDEEGNEIPPEFDPRQPAFLEDELPGLIGAWQAEVDVRQQSEGKAPAYLYVLSNHSLWLDDDDDAIEFHQQALDQIAHAFGTQFPSAESWVREDIPPDAANVDYQRYATWTFTAGTWAATASNSRRLKSRMTMLAAS
jgi:hypothetical protein